MSEENKAVARRFFDAWNEGDLDALDEVMAPDAENHDPQDPFPSDGGAEAAKKLVSMYREAFPDVHFEVDHQVAEGDYVVTRWTATGTHEGELMGIPATGKRSTVTGVSIDRFEGGRIVEGWTNWDTLGMMQQLGLVPAAQAVS
jgi:steroid delta-isomerase-like uncharacterized protein